MPALKRRIREHACWLRVKAARYHVERRLVRKVEQETRRNQARRRVRTDTRANSRIIIYVRTAGNRTARSRSNTLSIRLFVILAANLSRLGATVIHKAFAKGNHAFISEKRTDDIAIRTRVHGIEIAALLR